MTINTNPTLTKQVMMETPHDRQFNKQLGLSTSEAIAITASADHLALESLQQIGVNLEGKKVSSTVGNMVDSMQPTSAIETILALQIANLHLTQSHMMKECGASIGGIAAIASNGATMQAFINGLTKLSNTTAHLVLTFKRLQTNDINGDIKINDVYVASGGQAVVGNIHASHKIKSRDDTQ